MAVVTNIYLIVALVLCQFSQTVPTLSETVLASRNRIGYLVFRPNMANSVHSLGNFLSSYFEAYCCALVTGISFEASIPCTAADAAICPLLKKLIHHHNATTSSLATTEIARSRIKESCPCSVYCHQVPEVKNFQLLIIFIIIDLSWPCYCRVRG